MNITEVYFERVFNLGDYQTMRIGFHATVGPSDTPEAVVEKLSAFTTNCKAKAIIAGRPKEAKRR